VFNKRPHKTWIWANLEALSPKPMRPVSTWPRIRPVHGSGRVGPGRHILSYNTNTYLWFLKVEVPCLFDWAVYTFLQYKHLPWMVAPLSFKIFSKWSHTMDLVSVAFRFFGCESCCDSDCVTVGLGWEEGCWLAF